MFSQQEDNMEAAALCFRLMMLVFILLVSHVQNRDAAFRIVPNRLQVCELESVFFHCEGLDGSAQLRGIRNTQEFMSACDESMSVLVCTVHRAYREDSGEYWCETTGGQRSNSINVSVTVGSVILDSPVLPVMEGNNVTLSCRNQTTSSNLTADFYKDGRLMKSSSTGQMIIHSVSKSDEGLYKCLISDVGESPQSWLAVRAVTRETCPSSDQSSYVLLLLRTVLTIVMFPLLLVVGLLHCGKLPLTHK